jgi:hypothetical protein
VIHCKYDELLHPDELNEHPLNRNKHSKDQIQRLSEILEYQGWRHPIKISILSGCVTSGHGRLLAAKLRKWKEVPVVYQNYQDSDMEYADLIADNAIASWSSLELDKINVDLETLGPDLDIDMLGMLDFKIEPADKEHKKDASRLSIIVKFNDRDELQLLFDELKSRDYVCSINQK